MTRNQKTIAVVAAVTLLIGGSAALASYVTRDSLTKEPEVATKATTQPRPQQIAAAPAPVQQLPACDDKNIVGTVAGGAAGGLVGSQIGSGSGNTAAIIGGVVGGAVLGNEFIPTRNVTCR